MQVWTRAAQSFAWWSAIDLKTTTACSDSEHLRSIAWCLVCREKKAKNPPRAPQPQGAGPGAWVPRAIAHVCAIDDGMIESSRTS